MALYRNARYWLNDFRNDIWDNTKEEVFNQGHSKLRNVIERAFGVLKARFPILKRMTPYSFHTQKKIVMACFALHNFLCQISIDDILFSEYNEDEYQLDNSIDNHSASSNQFRTSDQVFMQGLREEIANQLFQACE